MSLCLGVLDKEGLGIFVVLFCFGRVVYLVWVGLKFEVGLPSPLVTI